MPFSNKPMVAEWISRNPGRMATLLESNVTQEKQTLLENSILQEYRTPEALRNAYTAALDAVKATGDTTAINYLNQQLASIGS